MAVGLPCSRMMKKVSYMFSCWWATGAWEIFWVTGVYDCARGLKGLQ